MSRTISGMKHDEHIFFGGKVHLMVPKVLFVTTDVGRPLLTSREITWQILPDPSWRIFHSLMA